VDRGNRYEAAFEEYLRHRGLPYIGVDETRRATLGDGPVKSLDFIVYGLRGARLLVDVKGRRFPGKSAGKPRYNWECWSTREDVDGLRRWQEIFGPGYEGAFVFMYELGESVTLPDDTPDRWEWRGSRYLLRAVLIEAMPGTCASAARSGTRWACRLRRIERLSSRSGNSPICGRSWPGETGWCLRRSVVAPRCLSVAEPPDAWKP
jgi:hypothetical protein